MCEGWPKEFENSEYLSFEPPMTEAAAIWWNARFRHGRDDTPKLFPAQFVDAIAADAPGKVSARIYDLDHVTETFKIEIVGIAEGKARIFFKAKTFEMLDGTVRDGETDVGPDWQGRGIGTGLMINLIDLGYQIGLDRITVDARDIGRYVWITMGFLPDATAWRRFIVPAASTKLKILLLSSEIDLATYMAGQEILANKDHRAIRDLLLFTETVNGPGPRGAFEEVILLKALMLQPGTEWAGAFDFREDAARDLFKAYEEAHDDDHPRPW